MSTRCQIIVQGSDVVLYRHSDGYPDDEHGVLAALKKIVKPFLKPRGWDTDYMPAQIIASMIAANHASLDATAKEKLDRKDSYEQYKYLSYAVEAYTDPTSDNALHGDIDYLYVIRQVAKKAGEKSETVIEIRKCDFDDVCNISKSLLVRTVNVMNMGGLQVEDDNGVAIRKKRV
jgi:hypothetical protein